MRTLDFIVTNETIEQEPSCDFNGLFPGKNDNVQARFIFSPEWDKRVKVVAFWSMLEAEYPPQILSDDDSCMVPKEALEKPAFKLQILGRSRDRIYKTNPITIYQRGGTR